MKQVLRKTMLTLAVLITLFGMVFLPGQADLAHADEGDAGGTRATATELTFGQTHSETIAAYDDEDYFKFTTTERGYVQVTLAHNEADEKDEGSGWTIYVLNEAGETLVSASGIKESWTSIALPYATGTVFYVRVASSGSYGAIQCVYDLTVTQTAADDWESELNGTKATATAINVDKAYHGILLNSGDEDYFKFVTTEHGYFQVKLVRNIAESVSAGSGWTISVLDDAGEVITSASGIKESWTSIVLPYAEAGRTFYVQVASSGSYGAVQCVYDLTVVQTETDDWESDPNGKQTTATEIKTDKTYHGILVNSVDEDYFKFTTSVHGYFQVSLAHNASDSHETNSGWNVRILDDAGEVLASASSIRNSWTSLVLPYAQAGRTFYVQVASSGSYGAFYCMYDLTVTQTAASDWELEANGTKAAATPIAVNQTYHGIMGSEGDKDFFRFQTTARGYFCVQLSHNITYSNVENPNWEIQVLNDAGEQMIRYYNIQGSLTTIVLPYAQTGKTFYIQVGRYSGYAQGAYDLKVLQTATTGWELEPNQTAAAATLLTSGKACSGITMASNDDDYFKVQVPAAGKLNVRLTSSNGNQPNDVRSGWTFTVYDSKLNELSKATQIKSADSVSLDVKKGTYYVRVCPYSSWSAPTYCTYDVTAIYLNPPAKPKAPTVKAAKKAATVKWKKVSGASGYCIYRSMSKKGQYKKVKTIKKGSSVSWKNTKLKSGKQYYYKIAAYKIVNGIVVESSCSSVKSVKVK